MAFKTVTQYNEERFGGLFLLRNDGDSANAVFLYQSPEDVLVADTHYIKSAGYSGYVHCTEHGCPACAKNIRVQTKLFIPLFNLSANEGKGEIQFWDRSIRFENQLSKDVFEKYNNPSEVVFRITRHGAAGSVDTTYEIQAVGRNTVMSYHEILAANKATMPAYYENVCKSVTAAELTTMLNSSGDTNSGLPAYTPTPRVSVPVADLSATIPPFDDGIADIGVDALASAEGIEPGSDDDVVF